MESPSERDVSAHCACSNAHTLISIHSIRSFREDPGQPHWYDTVFANDQVESFVSQALETYKNDSVLSTTSRGFTLTVAVPADSGSLHGWTINRLAVPGRYVTSGVLY